MQDTTLSLYHCNITGNMTSVVTCTDTYSHNTGGLPVFMKRKKTAIIYALLPLFLFLTSAMCADKKNLTGTAYSKGHH